MNERQVEIDNSMHELGQRIRAGHAAKNPTPQENIDVAMDAVRADWEKEQQPVHDQKPEHEPAKAPERQPDEPDMGR